MSLAGLASFWALCLAQGTIVLLPAGAHSRRLDALRARWPLVAAPAAVVIGATFVPRVAALLASDLSLLALISVPPLAAVGLAWAIRWRDVRFVPFVPLLLVIAWSAPESAPGDAAALLLVVLSCVALAALVVAVLPSVVAKLAIIVWAATDLSSALAHDLVRASTAISHAAPTVAPELLRLQLQRVVIGPSSMEFADLFVAALLGAILAAESRDRGPAALLVAVLAMSLAAFFFVTDVVPGTVPVAVALLVEELRSRLARAPSPWALRTAAPDRPADPPIGRSRSRRRASILGGMAINLDQRRPSGASTQRPVAYAIEATNLEKTYRGGIRALDGVSLRVPAGTIFALLGPNGAGKSTTVKILTTLSRADAGEARVAGLDVARDAALVRRTIGVVGQRAGFDAEATARENLELQAEIYGITGAERRARVDELLRELGLGDGRRLAKTYSGGMQRRLDIALGLVHRPQVLFLDEPTTGLDPEARADLWREIDGFARDQNVTILLTTHYLEEADRLASRLAIIDRGKIVAEGTPSELKSELRGDSVQIELADDSRPDAPAVLERLPEISEVSLDGRVLRARADHGATALPALITALERGGIPVASATISRPSLDDVYLRHAGRSFDEAGTDEPREEAA